jgi:predicted GTPase
VRASVRALNPRARIVDARLPVSVDDEAVLAGRRVLAVDDGPTLTHGGMPAGAAELVARRLGATLVDPRPYARGSIAEVFRAYPRLGPVLPAMGYSKAQISELEATINAVPCDVVLIGTPLDLRRTLVVRHPVARARYDVAEVGSPTLEEIIVERGL